MLLSLCACGAVSEPAATAEPTAAVTAAPAEETVEREYIECSGGYAYTEFVPMDDGADAVFQTVQYHVPSEVIMCFQEVEYLVYGVRFFLLSPERLIRLVGINICVSYGCRHIKLFTA